jgi:hypothetical protein
MQIGWGSSLVPFAQPRPKIKLNLMIELVIELVIEFEEKELMQCRLLLSQLAS